MKRTYFSSRTVLISCALCVLLLLGAVVPAFAGETAQSLHYGIEGRENNTVLSVTDLYSKLFTHTPTAAEKVYLESTGITMQYNALIPDNRISTFYDSENGTLDVQIYPYVYTAANGEQVTWIPQRARINGTTFVLTENEGVYAFRLTDVFYSTNFPMEVDYLWQVAIPADVANDLLNAAYREAEQIKAREDEHLKKLAAYNETLAKHQAWVAYQQWVSNYNAYLLEKAAHEAKTEAYETYLKEYDAYLVQKDAYDQWMAYFDYVDFKNNRLADYNKYQAYLKSLAVVQSKLEVMDILFVSDSHGWQVYSGVMGDTVTQVINRKNELVVAGADPGLVDTAWYATQNLRTLMSGYNDLRKASYASEHERIQVLYKYYTDHYEALTVNFKDLHYALYNLYSGNLAVRSYIRASGKLEHYLQLVGQLYVVSTCLDDTNPRDPNWKISEQSLTQVVESLQILKDTNTANPKNASMPTEVPVVEWVEPMDEPTVKKPDEKPIPPTEVKAPGDAPAPVEDPSTTTAPENVPHPGTAPVYPAFTASETALLSEIKNGTLKQRTPVSNAIGIRFETTVSRTVSIKNEKSVTFYNWDGSVLHSEMVEYGGSIYFPLPDREPNAEFTYRKIAWVSVDGADVDLSMIKTDLSLYPLYESTKRSYTVTWVLDGVTAETVYLYGSIPEPPMPLTREDGPYHRYEFSGWDKEVTPVSQNVTYTGSMVPVPKNFRVSWVINEGATTLTEEWPYGSIPTFRGTHEIQSSTHRYEFIGWDRAIGVVTGDVTYTANYRRTPLAIGGIDEPLRVVETADQLTVYATQSSADINTAIKLAVEKQKGIQMEWENGFILQMDAEGLSAWEDAGCRRIALSSQTQGNGIVTYDLHFYDNAWREMDDISVPMRVVLPYEKTELRETVYFARSLAAQESTWTRMEGYTPTVSGSVSLRADFAYRIKVAPNDLCNTMVMIPRAVAGEQISLALSCMFGYEVSGAKIVDEDGNVIPVEALSFRMPASAVRVDLEVTKIVYNVTFMVDGKVWKQATYGLGDEIILPEDPSKEAEEGYVYTFTGWGEVPSIAIGAERDLVFQANFSLSQTNTDYVSTENNDRLLTMYLPIGLGVILIIIVLLVIRKKKKNKELERLWRTRRAELERAKRSPQVTTSADNNSNSVHTERLEDRSAVIVRRTTPTPTPVHRAPTTTVRVPVQTQKATPAPRTAASHTVTTPTAPVQKKVVKKSPMSAAKREAAMQELLREVPDGASALFGKKLEDSIAKRHLSDENVPAFVPEEEIAFHAPVEETKPVAPASNASAASNEEMLEIFLDDPGAEEVPSKPLSEDEQ